MGWAQAGGRAQGTPWSIWISQVPSVTSAWCLGQRSARLSMSVSPWSVQGVTWWIVAEVAGGGAAGDDAADVPSEQRGLLGGGGEAVAAAEVQDGAVLVEEDAADLAGAGEHGQDAGVDRSGVLGVREPEPTASATASTPVPLPPVSAPAPALVRRWCLPRRDRRREAEVEGVGQAGVSWWWAGGVEACGGEVFGGGGDDDLDVGVGPGPHPGWPPDLEFPFRRWRVAVLGKVLHWHWARSGSSIPSSMPSLNVVAYVAVDVAVDSVICLCLGPGITACGVTAVDDGVTAFGISAAVTVNSMHCFSHCRYRRRRRLEWSLQRR